MIKFEEYIISENVYSAVSIAASIVNFILRVMDWQKFDSERLHYWNSTVCVVYCSLDLPSRIHRASEDKSPESTKIRTTQTACS